MAATGRGLVVRVTPDGTLVDVIHDPIGRCAELEPGRASILSLVDTTSRPKGERLLDELRREGCSLAWELLLADGSHTPLRFAGLAEDGYYLLLASPPQDDLSEALGGIASINNSVVNRLRELERAQAELSRTADVETLTELGRLNNELVDLHRELAKRTTQLEEADEQKNRLIGMAAHDLRNPLGTIRGFAQLLLRRLDERLDDRERLMLERIEGSSDRLLDLVTDLLELSELERPRLAIELDKEPCDLIHLVELAVEMARALADAKDIRIELDAPSSLEAVVDEGKLEQVLTNLLTNAIKFSEPGTTVRTRLALEGETVVLEVQDQGQGIPEEERQTIFEPFYRSSVQPTGGERSTGLGLAIVRRIVDGHGGRIELDTAVGVGSTFRVLLPRMTDDEAPPSQSPEASVASTPARSQPTTDRTSS